MTLSFFRLCLSLVVGDKLSLVEILRIGSIEREGIMLR